MSFKIKDFKSKIEAIDKYYKNDILFLSTYFEDYNTFNLYIRLDYEKSSESYKLRWFDLDRVKSSKIKKYESSEYLEEATVDYIKEVVAKIDVENSNIGPDNNVSLFINSECKNKKYLDVKFYRYIPESMNELWKVFEILFFALPKKINSFYEEVIGKNILECCYDKTFRFNLLEDDLSLLYDADSMEIGERFYREDKVLFLEKVGNRFFAAVQGQELCIIAFKYDENSHDMRVTCTCPMRDFCKHIYAVVKAIRENKFNSFYKVVAIDMKKMDLKTYSFNYILSVGILKEDGLLGIITDDGELLHCNILDEKGNLLWDVIEDDTDNGLTETFNKMK